MGPFQDFSFFFSLLRGIPGDMIEPARDRSIVIPMQRMPTRKCWHRLEAKERGEQLMKRCAALMQDRTDDIDDAIANFAGLPFLLEREEEIWTPLFVMCEVVCSERRKELEQAAADLCAQNEPSPNPFRRDVARLRRMRSAMESAWSVNCWRCVRELE
jgi:hypothetical protein